MSSRQAREHLVDQLGTGALDNAGRPWTVVDDVSIPDGFEIVSPPLARDDLPLLESIFLRLRAAGARPAPGRAGLHVHVDATPFGPCELRNLIVHWGNLEPTLAHLFRVHPRRAVRYCRPVLSFARAVAEETSGGQGDIVAIWSENWCADSQAARRHRSLNLESYKSLGTIEFRLFGSMHRGEELRAVVLTVIGLAAGALDHACSARFAPDDLPRSRAEAVKTIVALGRRLSLAPADWHAVTRVLGHYVSKNTYGAGRPSTGLTSSLARHASPRRIHRSLSRCRQKASGPAATRHPRMLGSSSLGRPYQPENRLIAGSYTSSVLSDTKLCSPGTRRRDGG